MSMFVDFLLKKPFSVFNPKLTFETGVNCWYLCVNMNASILYSLYRAELERAVYNCKLALHAKATVEQVDWRVEKDCLCSCNLLYN